MQEGILEDVFPDKGLSVGVDHAMCGGFTPVFWYHSSVVEFVFVVSIAA